METLNSLDAIQNKVVKMLIESKDEAVNDKLAAILEDLSVLIAKEMKRAGVEYIG